MTTDKPPVWLPGALYLRAFGIPWAAFGGLQARPISVIPQAANDSRAYLPNPGPVRA